MSRKVFLCIMILLVAISSFSYLPQSKVTRVQAAPGAIQQGVVESSQPAAPPPPEIHPESAAYLPEAPALPEGLLAPPEVHAIQLKSRTFIPGPSDSAALDSLASPASGRVHFLLQLDYIPRKAAFDALESQGLRLLAYVPDYAWITSYSSAGTSDVLDLPGVTWAGELGVADKLDPTIQAGIWSDFNLTADNTAAVYVVMHKDESLDTGRRLVQSYGGVVTGQAYGTGMLIVEMPLGQVYDLAAEDAVQWIEPAAPPLGPLNDGSRALINVDAVNAAPYGLSGTNVDVLVYDSGQVGAHIDFGGRLTNADTDVISEHSTHVAGTIGGSGQNSAAQGGSALQWRGMAPAVDLISYGTGWGSGIIFYEDVGDIEHDWAQAQNTYGADLANASVGPNFYSNYPTRCDLMGRYGASDVLVDQIVRGGNSLVGIGDKYIASWAAGNERGSASSCSNTYNSTAPAATSKNPIHVGAINTNNSAMTGFSSWGPTQDGRIKPNVVAGGEQSNGDFGITSTDNNPVNDYRAMQGTSMASPAVAGSIALMLEHYRDVYNTSGRFWPSTAKAILMHTATDLGNPGPDYQHGYGLVNIQASVDLISRRGFRQDNVSAGGVDVFSVVNPRGDVPFTVSLAWDDFEATANANPTLINNLDLELEAPSGTLWRPWVLNPASPADNATRGVDNRNNQEQVAVPTPEVGTWIVRVRGTTVPQGPQDYTLVCEGCKPLDLGVCQTQVATLVTATDQAEADSLPADELQAEETTVLQPVTPLSHGEHWQHGLEAAAGQGTRELAVLETARQEGPQAVVALQNSLRGRALDEVMDEIQAAMDELAAQQPPLPDHPPVSEAEESAMLSYQQAEEAADRALALAAFSDPAEGIASEAIPNEPYDPNTPAADRTVGAGCTHGTIAAAISAASPGDRLLLEGNVTFNEHILVNKNLTIEGGYNGCASASSARTVINGGGSGGSVVTINAGLTVAMLNTNITNGVSSSEGGGIEFANGAGGGTLTLTNMDIFANTAAWGGGVWVGPDTDLVGDYVNIFSNTATIYGGGLRQYGSRASFTNSNINNNTAPSGAGVYASLQSGIAPSLDLPSSADLTDNQALSGNGYGGGVYLSQGMLYAADCSDIYSNDAILGGGAYLITSTLTLAGSCSEIQNNTATGSGGGVYARGSTLNLDEDAEIYNNDASAGSGGGAYLDGGSLYADKASVRYNSAASFGGGIYATNNAWVDFDLGGFPCAGVRCAMLSNNTATNNYGGGIYANSSTVYLDNTFVESNTANLGGGVYASSSPVNVNSSLFARNNATANTGDGVRLFSSSSLSGSGNTWANNNAAGATTGQAIGLSTSTLNLACSVIWGHASSIDVAGLNVTYSDVQGGYTGTGNMNQNPLFINAASQDYHLQTTSPVIDRCISGPASDFENQPRPIVRTNAGAPYDMGADEVIGVDRVGVDGVCSYPTIQQAVNAASDGATIRIATGAYFETVDVAGKNLTIQGGYDATCATPGTGTSRVDAGMTSGSVFDINGGVVNLRDLRVTWGNGIGGGIDVIGNATVVLENVDVNNNRGSYGGGIYISTGSSLSLDLDSDVYANTATIAGGGARVWGSLFGLETLSDIYANCAPDGGGVSVPGGVLSLDGPDVFSNLAAGASGKGGGVYVDAGGQVTLEGNAWIGTTGSQGNTAYDGAGIFADASTIEMAGTLSRIVNNTASHYGGGIYLANGSQLSSEGSQIGYTTTANNGNEATFGAGIYAADSQIEFSGLIQGNEASEEGGGLYAAGGETTLTDAIIGGAGANEPNRLGASGNAGAGLSFASGAHADLDNTLVSSNLFETAGYTYGGGVFAAGSVITLTNNSRVEHHLAQSVTDGRGAGVYLLDSTATIDHSQVVNNTAGTLGGGLRLIGASTLSVLNGSEISYNQASNGVGGGIAATSTADIDIAGVTMHENEAGTHGGAVYLNAGTLDLNGVWDLRFNDAGGNGGALAIEGTSNASLHASTGNSYLGVNHASGNGGGIYLGNNDTLQMYATSGYQIQFNTNTANGNGGGGYANAGGFFDVYGGVLATSNAAAGNGGVFYLSGGSRLWLDDYANIAPQVWVNQADNGGAIYATGGSRVDCDGAEIGFTNNGNRATAGSGGAIYLDDSDLDASNCTFRNSQATLNGGAVAAYNSSSVVIHADLTSSSSLESQSVEDRTSPDAPLATGCNPLLRHCSSFYINLADSDGNYSGNGGAIYLNNSSLSLNQNYLHDNQAARGGAIFQEGASAASTVYNTLFYRNVSTDGFGAGIRSQAGTFDLRHVTLADNDGGAGYSQSGTTSQVRNSIAWDNEFGGFLGTYSVATCNIDQNGNAGTNTNPLFWYPGNYHLLMHSPAVDVCATGLTPDLDNVTRPIGSNYDMGAYEYVPRFWLPLLRRDVITP